MIQIPTRQHFTIIEYRGFHDVPRFILAKDESGGYWVLASPFDDATDEYSESYSIVEAGQDEAYARTVLCQHCSGKLADPTCTLPVAALVFDSTKRASFRVAGPTPDQSFK
ncbi:hypothetical protein [Stenotrophomonas oahuensis]|uniref:Uncharacterized protein n=1 Tax=Stenotrophomonas oahuensis TaxID=3003271 RepID=A0ABY9YN26_9GAMM|nr:hypothetical protein [Stenotrophomonas sp. A5586]WNH52301.1 hypothetical protein PDM29_18525 [Stenotrophomonas sp. A5586]